MPRSPAARTISSGATTAGHSASTAAYDELPGLTVLRADSAERVPGARVSAGFLRLLGISPARGRGFSTDDERLNAAPVALVSSALFERLYGPGAPLAGRTLKLDSGTSDIVGILPADFVFPHMPRVDVLVPLRLDEATERGRMQMSILQVIGRMRADATMSQVKAELLQIHRQGEASAERAMPQGGPGPEGAPGPGGGPGIGRRPRGWSEARDRWRPAPVVLVEVQGCGWRLPHLRDPTAEHRCPLLEAVAGFEMRFDGPGGPGGPSRWSGPTPTWLFVRCRTSSWAMCVLRCGSCLELSRSCCW